IHSCRRPHVDPEVGTRLFVAGAEDEYLCSGIRRRAQPEQGFVHRDLEAQQVNIECPGTVAVGFRSVGNDSGNHNCILMYRAVARLDEYAVSAGGYRGSVWLERNLASPDAAAFVAEATGGLVASALGTVGHHPPSPGNPDGVRGHVSNVVTLPAWRRNGLARCCVDRLLCWFEQYTGAASVDLFATGDGTQLYAEFGFQQRPYPAMRLDLPATHTLSRNVRGIVSVERRC